MDFNDIMTDFMKLQCAGKTEEAQKFLDGVKDGLEASLSAPEVRLPVPNQAADGPRVAEIMRREREGV